MKSLYVFMRTSHFLAVVALLFVLRSQAHAGYWEPAYYVWHGKAQHKEVNYRSNYYDRNAYDLQITTRSYEERAGVIKSRDFHSPPGNDTRIQWQPDGDSHGSDVAYYERTSPKPMSSFVNTTVYAVLKWHRNSTYDNPTHEAMADPNDNPPPTLYVREQVMMYAQKISHSSVYRERLTMQAHAGNKDLRCVLGSSNWLYVDFVGLKGYWANPSKTIVRRIKVTGDIVKLPSVAMSANISLSAGYVADDAWGAGDVSLHYHAQPVTFAVLARLKGDNDPADLQTGYGWNWPSGPSASVAAGGLATDKHEHEADLVLQVTGQDGQPVRDAQLVPMPQVKIGNAAGVEKSAVLQAPGTPSTQTDSNGRLYLGSLLSRDLTSSSGNTTYVHLKNIAGTGATIYEVWGNENWSMGTNGELPWNADFIASNADVTRTVVFKPRLSANPLLAITNHTMRFLVTRVKVREWEDDRRLNLLERVYVLSPRWAAPNETAIVASPAKLNTYASVGGIGGAAIISDSGGGVYKGTLFVPQSDEWMLDDLSIVAEDQGVYHQP